MSNIHGFGSARDERKDGEGDEQGQNYYAGGGGGQGGSGLNVIDPGEGNGEENSVERIFQRAQADTAQHGADGGPPATVVRITMYRNGFTVDDGPFRAIDDPQNRPFLADLERGFVPRELMANVDRGDALGARVDVELNDKRGENYTPPPEPAYTAFAGAGNAIGGGAVEETAIVAADEESATELDLTVDETKPKTTIQIRTHDRRRLRGTFNLDMTIRHVQAFLQREQGDSPPYVLMAGYPPRRLADFEKTIEEAGLANAAVTQQLA